VGFWDYFTFRFLQGEAASDGGASARVHHALAGEGPAGDGWAFLSVFLSFLFFFSARAAVPSHEEAGGGALPLGYNGRLPTPLVVLARLDNEPALLASVQLKEPES